MASTTSNTMGLVGTGLTALVAAEHIYILILEMFLWTKPRGQKTFKLSREFAEQTKALAANQGLYNGFLAAGLCWSLLHPSAEVGRQISIFNLGCCLVAGVFGGLTANPRIMVVQAGPALVSLIFVLAGL